MFSRSTLRQFLGGIALFLYALDVIEGLAKGGGVKFQKWIESMTGTKTKSIILGMGLVNILQSSSAVSLIILALVGGGLIALNHAVAMIIGMNIGSVFMEALIGLFGLGFDMDSLIMPMIAIGGLGAMFSKRYHKLFLGLMCLGLVFYGLEHMKDSIKFLRSAIDLSSYVHMGWGRYILIGLIGTIIIQSSSAMTIITMTALFENIIPFPMAAAVLMGAYIGTTSTAMFVALGSGSSIKKQVAISHFLFNMVTCGIFALGFSFVTNLITTVRGFGSNQPWFMGLTKSNVNGLIIFFLLFKSVGGLIHIPFINSIAILLEKIIPNNQKETLGIDHIDPTLDKQTIIQILYHDTTNLHLQHIDLIDKRFMNPHSYSEDTYYTQKKKFDKLFQFAVQHQDNSQLVDYLQETMQALKLCKDTMKSFGKIYDLKDNETSLYLQELYHQIESIIAFIRAHHRDQASDAIRQLALRDESKMQLFTHTGKPVSEAVIELIQIHDHIHGSLESLVEAGNNIQIAVH
ncbi:MAG TPA: Na/Pi symporter [Candidatus Absconditabacterales bacterium]|nr:Na/Pi symporter [Candidatus Absconditabacterales bacterium]